MALRFLFGSSGSGKTHFLCERILEQSRQMPEQLFFVVVPEQFTMQTQREFVERQENHGIMNIDVVSFRRLAYRVFDELGLSGLRVLGETGKSLVLRKLAQEKEGELTLLRGSMKKRGYIGELKSMISELAQYRVLPGQLLALEEDGTLPAPFRMRVHDIRVMYEGFREYLEGNYITSEEILEVLARVAPQSKLLRGAIFALDGFTGFTPVQYALLGELMRHVGDIYVTVTLDGREDPWHCRGMQELFYLSKKTIRTLSDIAAGQGVEVAEPIVLRHGGSTRFRESRELEWLEQNLFRNGTGAYQGTCGGIVLRGLKNPREELLYLAGEICRLVREEGYRYREIAVVCGDVSLYGNYVPEVFGDYGIPYFLDKKDDISFHPFTELIKEALRTVESDFAQEHLLACLRTGLAGVAQKDVDLLENYLLANRIRGKSRWQEKWVRLSGLSGVEELERVNEIRSEVLYAFSPLLELDGKEMDARGMTVALYEFIVGLDIQKQLEARRQVLERQGRMALAKEYAQIYRTVMDLLDKLAGLLAEERMGIREYREILEAGFEASLVGTIPPGYDQVLIGDIERSRLPAIRALFLVGVNDGLIPKSEGSGGLISEQEREVFAAHGMELAPGAREKAFIQKFYLYLNLTRPSEKLYVTWFAAAGDGKEARRSYLVGMLCRMFPSAERGEAWRLGWMPDAASQADAASRGGQGGADAGAGQEPPSQANATQRGSADMRLAAQESLLPLATPRSSRRLLVEGLQLAREGQVSPAFLSLLHWYRSREAYRPQAEALLGAAFYVYQKQLLGRDGAKELYGEVLENSVTRLERFASCAYAHFLEYGIGLKERQLGEFAPVDVGSLFHAALERYSNSMEEAGYHWLDVPKDVQGRLMEEAVEATVAEAGYLLDGDARTAYAVTRLTRILKKTVETIGHQIAESAFSPEGYEVSFSFAEDLESVNFTLGEEERMRLRGKIDRLDVKEEGDQVYVKVVDYKSGDKQFSLVSLYYGLQLQLVVYLNAAVELMKMRYPGREVRPAGMFYYHIDDPIIESKGELSEEEVREKVNEQLRLNGVSLSSSTDASVSKRSRQVDGEQLKLLSDFVNVKIRELGAAIYRGEAQASPYRMGQESGCDYCPFHGICGFDTRLPGFSYRKILEPGDEEILERMRKEVADGHDIHEGTAPSHRDEG